jgi:UDP-glucose 4-epimerase
MPTALVTGGAGFLGSHAVEQLLSQNYQVKVIDNLVGGRKENIEIFCKNPNFIFIEDDIRTIKFDSNLFENIDFILHFAGIGDIVPSIQKPEDYISVNVQGTIHILEAMRKNKIKRMVYAASSSCYGANPKTPTHENSEIENEYPYALSKYLGEISAFHWSKVYGIEVNSIRIFNAYGTRSRTSGAYGAVFGVFLKQKLERKPFTLIGDGRQKRDFVYASDVAKAFILAGQSNLIGQIWNLGSNNPIEINQLIKLLKGPVIKLPKRPGEPEITWADTTKIEKDLGWRPEISFETGVAKVLEKINYWENAPLWDKSSIDEATKEWFQYMREK